MAGLYLHIPFCKLICAYCDFFRSAELKYLPDVVRAMHSEMDEERDFLHDKSLQTIYFGGGTPSLLHPDEFTRFIDHADALFDCNPLSEITIEANPDDIDRKYVEALRHTPVNRVSLGVQSFDDEELRFMNRRHSAMQAHDAVKRLQDSGIENITIDLIFGVAGFGDAVLRRSILTALSLGVQHISAYHLTIEPDTTFGRRLRRGELSEVAEGQSEREYRLVEELLTASGYEHYEVSNYALEGFRSRHNSSYWQGVEYLGIGSGAHSFNGDVRRWCQQPLPQYITNREYESETLSSTDRYNEYLMTSLRCAEGVDLQRIASQFGDSATKQLLSLAEPWIGSGKLVREGDTLRIPTSEFLLSDSIISSLFEL